MLARCMRTTCWCVGCGGWQSIRRERSETSETRRPQRRGAQKDGRGMEEPYSVLGRLSAWSVCLLSAERRRMIGDDSRQAGPDQMSKGGDERRWVKNEDEGGEDGCSAKVLAPLGYCSVPRVRIVLRTVLWTVLRFAAATAINPHGRRSSSGPRPHRHQGKSALA
jgi:hypothetical protein